MRVTRELFEMDRYPDRFSEFRRLMAFCDGQELRMAFFVEPPFIGIVVYDRKDNAITRYTEYTMYYHTMDKKVYFLDSEDWEEGMGMLNAALDKTDRKSDEDIIGSLGSTIL